MFKRIILFLLIFVGYTLLFILGKPVFTLANAALFSGMNIGEFFAAVGHGLSMDLCMAAYLTAPCGFMLAIAACVPGRWLAVALRVWRYLSVFLAVATIALDAVLYSYWNFKLDTTPLFYFLSSPAMAMASVPATVAIAGTAGLIIVSWAVAYALGLLWRLPSLPRLYGRSRLRTAACMLILTAALFIPIRGGFTVSTMNPSAAYFSSQARLNHLAVNPMFSFIYSAAHSSRYDDRYQYFSPDELTAILGDTADTACETDTARIFNTDRPDIYLVILESFSTHLMPSLGGEPVARRLDSIGRSGIMFTNFYASSFRTDRAIPAILSGLPAQPSTSVMKYVDIAEKLPSVAATLRDSAGYSTSYYYGGDINFVNQKAYLVSGGFDRIVSDVDFPVADRMSKWGAPDHAVWRRLTDDLRNSQGNKPQFRVVQTSSSHEPFDVPYSNPAYPDERANAFAYADSCLGAFVDSLRASALWQRAAVVIVADHWGAYPRNLTDPVERHHIPLIITGGALSDSMPRTIDTPAAQNDIAATLLAALGIGYDDFKFSRNIFGSGPHRAFFCEPDFAAVVAASDTTVVSLADGRTARGTDARARLPKAILQNLYKYLSEQ